jgi:hypothetical protein
MANTNVSVLIPLEVYVKFVKREIRPSDLKMVLQPVDSLEGVKTFSDREVIYKEMYMPDWFKDWYKTLERTDRLRFATIINERLNQMLGGVA